MNLFLKRAIYKIIYLNHCIILFFLLRVTYWLMQDKMHKYLPEYRVQ